MAKLLRILATSAWLVAVPVTALAQSAINGVVRDASGGVLPGVTVEAASEALIERVRTAVTDDQGLYRLLDLRPGTYTLTFSAARASTTSSARDCSWRPSSPRRSTPS